MRLRNTFLYITLALSACSAKQKKTSSQNLSGKPTAADAIDTKANNTAMLSYLNRKYLAKNGSYYLLKQFSDSSAKIIWGNDTIKREYEEPLDLIFVDRLSVEWVNKDYLILNYFTGSNAWISLVLPLNNQEKVQEFGNGLYFDDKDNYLVTEGVVDTVVSVHNLKTQREQLIIEKQRQCESIMNNACIDTISIYGRVLYYKWVTPRTDIMPNRKIERRVRLRI